MEKLDFCPNCGIGLSNNEKQIGCCQNCETFFDEDDFDDNDG